MQCDSKDLAEERGLKFNESRPPFRTAHGVGGGVDIVGNVDITVDGMDCTFDVIHSPALNPTMPPIIGTNDMKRNQVTISYVDRRIRAIGNQGQTLCWEMNAAPNRANRCNQIMALNLTPGLTTTELCTLARTHLCKQFARVFCNQLPPSCKINPSLWYDVQTTPGLSVHQRPAKLDRPVDRALLQRTLNQLVELHILKRATGPCWTSRARVVAKKKLPGQTEENTIGRLVCNFVPLNKITKKDDYPLPNLEEIRQEAGGHTLFMTMDFFKGFHQVPVVERTKFKSGIVTEEGTHLWERMPMGGCNGPSTFQRVIDTIYRSEIATKQARFYLDDVLIWGNSVDEIVAKAGR